MTLLRIGLIVGGCVALVHAASDDAAPSAQVPVKPARSGRIAIPAFAAPATPVLPDPEPALVPTLADDEPEGEPEEVRGHTEITDPAELAMVFTVDGVTYLQLDDEPDAELADGSPRMTVSDGVYSVVAEVSAAALPDETRGWLNRTVVVGGDCRAHVVGFATVSRAAGEPPGMWEYDEAGETGEPPAWTIEGVRASGGVLAARLDGCAGTWARATSYPEAAVAELVDRPALVAAAVADLTARPDDPTLDLLQAEWEEAGGEGDWRDAASIRTSAYHHPLTGEDWVFVQAYREGGCGDPGLSAMAAYRVGEGGRVQRFADLAYAHATIDQVVDLDGDGQPELVLADGDHAQLVDLNNTTHVSIDVPYHQGGCGC